MSIERDRPAVLAGQCLHLFALAGLLTLTAWGWDLLGRPFPVAFWTAIAVPVIHQVFVWLAWRLELRGRTVSRTIGFRAYVVLFFVLFFARPVTLLILAWLDQGSLGLPLWLRVALTAVLAILGVYAGYSVARYFGMARATGADHFDPRYRKMPLVREGIFRFTSNAMYVYAFLLFWAVAIGFDSSAALLAAAFAHAYIWVHYVATERPDMVAIYRP